MHEIVDLIDRHFDFLKTQRLPHLLPHLRRTMAMLVAEPRIRILLEEERRALDSLHKDFDCGTQALVEDLKQLRERFIELAPELDDASQPHPEDFASSDDPWFRTFAAFDAQLNPSSPLNVLAGRSNIRDQTQAAQLLWILTQKLNQARHARQGELGDEMEQLAGEIYQQNNAQIDRWRDYFDSIVAAPGSDLVFLEYALRAIGSNQLTRLNDLDERTLSMTGRRSLGTVVLEPVLFGKDSSDEGRRRAEQFEEKIRQAINSLHHGLRLRVGTVISRLVVFERFKTRCEMHDRERLLGLAKVRSGEPEELQPSSQHHPRTKPEQRLTEELARYLYDNGLNPLTEVPIGNARADLLSADRLYVEAKQYVDGNPATYVLKGVSQTAHMVERLSSTAYRLEEAFLVVFRRGGKRLVMQTPITMGTWVLHCVVVDLGESSESGNRAPEAIELTADQIRSAALTPP